MQQISSNQNTKPILSFVQPVNYGVEDYAQKILWFSIGLQILFLAGSYWKIGILTSDPIFYAQFFSPAAIVVVASTWRRAIKFSFLSSLVIPGGVSLLLVLAAVISYLLKSEMGSLLKYVGMNIQTSLMVWVIILTISMPSIATGILIRFTLSKFRLNPRK